MPIEKEIFSQAEHSKLLSFASVVLLVVISGAAFGKKVRAEILARDGGSVISGATEHLHASHLDHDKSKPWYNKAENGETLTVFEHLQFHQAHVGRAEEIGLKEHHNNFAIRMLGRLANKILGIEE